MLASVPERVGDRRTNCPPRPPFPSTNRRRQQLLGSVHCRIRGPPPRTVRFSRGREHPAGGGDVGRTPRPPQRPPVCGGHSTRGAFHPGACGVRRESTPMGVGPGVFVVQLRARCRLFYWTSVRFTVHGVRANRWSGPRVLRPMVNSGG